MHPVISVILGLILLLFGRRLYWIFVAIAGFLVGMVLADHWLTEQQEWLRVLIAIAAGVLGAIVGVFVQRLAFAIGGFYAGGYIALSIAAQAGGDAESTLWFAVGGVIGAVIAAMLMDMAIIVLSSLAGAAAIVSPFAADISPTVQAVLFIAIAAVGIAVQRWRMAPRRAEEPPAAR